MAVSQACARAGAAKADHLARQGGEPEQARGLAGYRAASTAVAVARLQAKGTL